MPLIRLPVDRPTQTTLEVGSDITWRTGRDLLGSILNEWLKTDRGELTQLEDDDPAWAVIGWTPSLSIDEESDSLQHFNDLLDLDGPLPSPLPAELALTIASSPLLIRFDRVPSIPDGSTHICRCLPWWTVEHLIEHLCERHSLIRRLTLGGETRSRGRDRWGGGTRVDYAIEEVWADEHGHNRNLAIAPDVLIASLLDQPHHKLPSLDAPAQPAYRFCVPDSWLLRSPRPKPQSMVIPDGSTDDDPTVKDGRLTPAVEEEHPQPDSNDSGRDSSKRFSIFGSLLQTLVTTASTPELETAAPPTRTPPLKKRSGVDRMSVSDPIAMAFSPTLVPESMRSEVIADSDREDVVEDDDEHWQALFDRFAIRTPEAQARIKAMPAQKRNELFSKTGPSASSAAASLSQGSGGALRRLSLSGSPLSSSKTPSGSEAQRVENQHTGGSASGSKRFSIASLWGDPDDDPTPLPVAKQDTGGWSAWWSGTKASDGNPYLVAVVKELSLSTITIMKIRTTLGSVSRTLSSAPKEICEHFIELRGIDALRKVLARLVRPPLQERGDLASQSVVEILNILQSIMRYGGPTHSAVISDAELMSLLTLAFEVPSFKVGTALAKLLTGLAILPDILNTAVVLEAFTAGRLLTGDRFRFQRLVDCLASHDDWERAENPYAADEHCFSVLTFIGRLCAANVNDVEARILLRDEFERTGIKERLVAIRYSQPPERIADCLEDWKEDAAHDQLVLKDSRRALLDRLADDDSSLLITPNGDSLDTALGRLQLLSGLSDNADELAATVSDVLRMIIEIVHRDVDSYTKDTLLSVLRVFTRNVADIDNPFVAQAPLSTDIPSILASPTQPVILATAVIDTLTRKEDEIRSLRAELDQARNQVTNRKRTSRTSVSLQDEKDFKARVAPPPPPPPSSARRTATDAPRQLERAISGDSKRRTTAVVHHASTSDAVEPVTSSAPPAFEASKTPMLASVPATAPTDVRAALFAAIRTGPKVPPPQPLSDQPPTSDAPDHSALMTALRSRPTQTRQGISSNTPKIAVTISTPLSASAESASVPHNTTSDPRAALMAALRSRPIGRVDDLPINNGAESGPAPIIALAPAAPHPAASSRPEVETATGPPLDLRAALMAGIKRGPPIKSPSFPAVPPAPPVVGPSKKLKPFFWRKLALDEVQATIWSDLPKEILALDLLELEQTFSIAPIKAPASKDAVLRRPQAITFLDITRSNNIGILLARFKLPISGISHAILNIDDDVFGLDDLKNLSRLLPTAEELSRITAFEDHSKLAKPDLYFKEIGRIPRLQTRLECMLFRSRFDLDFQETIPDLEKLASATQQLRSSERLKKVLKIVLCIGNALNTATFRGGASGFAMEALLKLRETRTARSDCPTLLHFVARTIVKTSPGLALFIDDMPSVSAAARINVSTVSQSVAQLVSGVAKIRIETSQIRAAVDWPSGDRFTPVMEAFVSRVELDVDRVQALGRRVSKELDELLVYFGEQADGPEATRPEDFFGMILSFSMSLQTAAAEVTKHLAAKPVVVKQANALQLSRGQASSAAGLNASSSVSDKLLIPAVGPSAAPGELDAAIRSLHHASAARTRRAEQDRSQQRPLSKMFLDGGGGTTRTISGQSVEAERLSTGAAP